MKPLQSIFLLFIVLIFQSCIQNDYLDDQIDERVSFSNPIDEILLNDTHQLTATFFNNVGQEENQTFNWTSSQPNIISVTNNGLITALAEGNSIITAMVTIHGAIISEEISITVTTDPIDNNGPVEKTGTIVSTSSYTLTGDFTITEIEGSPNLDLIIDSNYQASSSLPGLYIYLSNNPNSISGAYEIGAVTVFNGSHNYQIPDTGINDYKYILYWCKPFSVKVGHGEIND